jgi:exopolysaccharide biosynthesis polyprenyl glycosylphosphotransferase
MTLIVLYGLAIFCCVWLVIRRHAFLTRPVVILGNGPMTAKLIDEVDYADGRCLVAGYVDYERPRSGTLGAIPWLGGFESLAEIVARVRPSRIIVALADRRGRLPLVALLESRIRGVVVEDAHEFYERLTGKIAIEALTPGALILGKGFRHDGFEQAVARAMSLLVAVAVLVLMAPVVALAAVLIKLDSKGPIFFKQERAGRDGKPFELIKFRTMYPAEERPSEWVQDNAHRITPVGKWLRRTRLDEVPQMINVFRGEMNLIGPRPHPTCNQHIFEENIAYYTLRSAVRPGITGWAQIRYGYANNLEQETEKMRYDLYYIKNHSLWLDIQILFETAWVMLAGHGATEIRRRVPKNHKEVRAALVAPAAVER